jgi:cation diffusion facilitator family transporter
VMARPPDRDHPYGHARAEAVATKAMAFIIALIGLQLGIISARELIAAQPSTPPLPIAVWATIVSLIGKGLLVGMLAWYARRIDSGLLRATAINMRSDLMLSFGVLAGLVITLSTGLGAIDTLVGLLVSLWLVRSAWQLFRLANHELMDGVADTSLYTDILEAVDAVAGATNPHRIRARQHGSAWLIDLDIEVDPDLTVAAAHIIARTVEDAIHQRIDNVYDIVVHIEPEGNEESDERFGVCQLTA